MNKKWKAKWIKALLSGKYKQGHGRLQTDNHKYCCLGVLCDIVAPDKWHDDGYYHMDFDDSPNPLILNKANLTNNSVNKLIELNDDERDSFKQIAAWIDKNL